MHLTVMYITVHYITITLSYTYSMYDFVHGMACSNSRRYTNNSTSANATLTATSSPNITTKLYTSASSMLLITEWC